MLTTRPESPRVIELLSAESQVVVSELARLEAETQLRSRVRGAPRMPFAGLRLIVPGLRVSIRCSR